MFPATFNLKKPKQKGHTSNRQFLKYINTIKFLIIFRNIIKCPIQ